MSWDRVFVDRGEAQVGWLGEEASLAADAPRIPPPQKKLGYLLMEQGIQWTPQHIYRYDSSVPMFAFRDTDTQQSLTLLKIHCEHEANCAPNIPNPLLERLKSIVIVRT